MVLRRSKCLHNDPAAGPTPYLKVLEYTPEDRQMILDEVKRWRVILSVNYANYKLEEDMNIQASQIQLETLS